MSKVPPSQNLPQEKPAAGAVPPTALPNQKVADKPLALNEKEKQDSKTFKKALLKGRKKEQPSQASKPAPLQGKERKQPSQTAKAAPLAVREKEKEHKKENKKDVSTPEKVLEKGVEKTPEKVMETNPIQGQKAPAKVEALDAKQVIGVVEKASSRILLARNQDPSEVQVRLELNDSLLPDTTLTAKKSPDGGLNLTFTTDNPEARELLGGLQQGLVQHLERTQTIPFHIQAASSEGQTFLQNQTNPSNPLHAQNNRQQDNPQQDKKPDWETVETRIKEDQ